MSSIDGAEPRLSRRYSRDAHPDAVFKLAAPIAWIWPPRGRAPDASPPPGPTSGARLIYISRVHPIHVLQP